MQVDVCYYCGAPMAPGAGTCRYCGTKADPLDVPLCDSESGAALDEAPVLRLKEPALPPPLPYEDAGAEAVSEPETPPAAGGTRTAPREEPADVPAAIRAEPETAVLPEETADAPAAKEPGPEKAPAAQPEEPADVPASMEAEPEPAASLADTADRPAAAETGTEALAEEPAPARQPARPEPVQAPAPEAREPAPLFDFVPGPDGTCVIRKVLGRPAGTLNIPGEIDGLRVTELGKSALAHCPVRRVTLPDTLRVIGDYAFTGCMGLAAVEGGAGVTSIGRGVFNGCLRLTRCDLLLNPGLRRPYDPFADRLMQRLKSAKDNQ